MKRHRAKANHDITQKYEDKHLRVAIPDHIVKALETKPHKYKVCEGINELSAVKRNVVILLCTVSI